jgi:class 3 adenylate cyclase
VAEQRVQRRLAAILAADVAGYSRLIGLDEIGTLAALKALRREIVDPAIAEHNGRIAWIKELRKTSKLNENCRARGRTNDTQTPQGPRPDRQQSWAWTEPHPHLSERLHQTVQRRGRRRVPQRARPMRDIGEAAQADAL